MGSMGTAATAASPIVAATSAIGGGVADFFSAKQSADAARDVNSENVRLAQEQMEFQERMSSTAFSRAAADMKRAGINPMLAAGAQASSPAGALPSQMAVPPTIGAFASGAKDMIRLLQDIRESNSRIDLNQKSGWSQWASAESGSEKNYATQHLIDQNVTTAKMQNEFLKKELDNFRRAPDVLSWMKILSDRGMDVGSGASVARAASEMFAP